MRRAGRNKQRRLSNVHIRFRSIWDKDPRDIELRKSVREDHGFGGIHAVIEERIGLAELLISFLHAAENGFPVDNENAVLVLFAVFAECGGFVRKPGADVRELFDRIFDIGEVFVPSEKICPTDMEG